MSLNSIKSILPRRGHHNSFLFTAERNMLTQIQCNSWTVKEKLSTDMERMSVQAWRPEQLTRVVTQSGHKGRRGLHLDMVCRFEFARVWIVLGCQGRYEVSDAS